ncbi:AraC family transcriptional regulator ligand-binding domain-containing protein [Roseibium sp.]|uniref:AraC family transcriptional regulator n=1 Tax=Roseibium sp. TaxID=1936156 RepID=UPI003A970AB1
MPNTKENDWVIARPLIRFAEIAGERGVDSASLIRASGLTPHDLGDPDNHIDVRSVFDAYERIAKALGDDATVFDIFASAPVGHGSVIDYVFLCAGTLEEGLRNWERFYPVRSDCIELHHERASGFGVLELRMPDHFGPNAQFTCGFLALLTSRIEDVIDIQPPPLRIELACKKPSSTSGFQEKFGNKISFDNQSTRVFIPERYLQMAPKTADPSLFRIIEAAALESLESAGPRTSQTSLIAAKICQGLRTGDCSIEYVAQSLGLSNRSLQRTLEREGTNYRSVLDSVRRSIAERYLVDTNRSIREIAFLLGFSEVSAFSRAVKNWFGVPPRKVRQR